MSDPIHPGCSIQLGELQAACPPSVAAGPGVDEARRLHIGRALASLAQQASYWGLGLGECALAAVPALRAESGAPA